MSDATPEEEPTAEELEKTKRFFSAARAIVRFCRIIDMTPGETVACLATSIALVIEQSENKWGPEQLQAVGDVIRMRLSERTEPQDSAS